MNITTSFFLGVYVGILQENPIQLVILLHAANLPNPFPKKF